MLSPDEFRRKHGEEKATTDSKRKEAEAFVRSFNYAKSFVGDKNTIITKEDEKPDDRNLEQGSLESLASKYEETEQNDERNSRRPNAIEHYQNEAENEAKHANHPKETHISNISEDSSRDILSLDIASEGNAVSKAGGLNTDVDEESQIAYQNASVHSMSDNSRTREAEFERENNADECG